MTQIIAVTRETAGTRLDVFVTNEAAVSRSQAQAWIADGCVAVNGKTVQKKYVLCDGDEVTIDPPPLKEYTLTPENIPLSVVYEDGDLLVVNKPKGMVVHPAAGHETGTLVHALLYHCGDSLSGINGVLRPGIVHRIDKDTSGLLMVAKNDMAHQGLAEQIKEHSFLRRYETVVTGHLRDTAGTVHAPIGRNPNNRLKMAVTAQNSKDAVTHYTVKESFDGYDRVEVTLETGRTHQIRVHMSYLGHPVAGDTLYGARAVNGFEGQCLHAKTLGFVHPRTGEYMEFESDLPPYFVRFLESLR
ncbi:MAG: RluA family pseudouridine synthase [Ruminococcaceae bacterium]|nr:RluA family pseudouridine synthase [Oscillospiraceae bacterium]